MNVIIAVVLASSLIKLLVQVCMFVCLMSGTKCNGFSIEDAYEFDDCEGTCLQSIKWLI